MKMDIK